MRLLAFAVVVAASVAAFAAETNLAWRNDTSGRSVPAPAVVSSASSSTIETRFRSVAESKDGIRIPGCAIIIR